MDLIAQALSKREKLKRDLDKIEAFLAVAYELQGEGRGEQEIPVPTPPIDKVVAAPVRRSAQVRAAAGVGEKTADIVVNLIREAKRGLSTRELVPMVEAHDIEIGGKDKIATLSARLSNDAKRNDRLRLIAGKWIVLNSGNVTNKEEAADDLDEDGSAASLFANQEGGGPIGTALN